jgi:G3E family GTPase
MAIGVQIITGFLGSGKTTLVRHLVEGPGAGRVGVVVGEYAEDGFDGPMIQASGATVRQITSTGRGLAARSYLPPTRSFAEEGRFDRIIVETSGVTEIAHVSQELAADPILGREAIFGPTIVVVDASSFASHDAHFAHQFWSQIDVADIVAVNKTDKVGSEVLDAIRRRVVDRNPEANVQMAFMGQLNRVIASAHPYAGFTPRALRAEWEGVLPAEFESFVFRSNRVCYDRVAFGHKLLNLPGGKVARFKGVLRCWDRSYCINGMPGQLDWDNTPVDGDTRVAFIGLGIDGRVAEISETLESELVRQREAMRRGDL